VQWYVNNSLLQLSVSDRRCVCQYFFRIIFQ